MKSGKYWMPRLEIFDVKQIALTLVTNEDMTKIDNATKVYDIYRCERRKIFEIIN